MPRSRVGARKINNRKWVCQGCGEFVKYNHTGNIRVVRWNDRRHFNEDGTPCGRVVNVSAGEG